MNLSQAITEFLEHVEIGRGHSMRTVSNYLHYLNRFQKFSKEMDVKDIDLDLIGRFRLHLNRLEDKEGERLLSRKTQNFHIIALRALLKYLIKRGLDVIAPDKIDLAKDSEREVSFLERDELESLLESVDTTTTTGKRDRALLELFYSTGLRVNELAALNRRDIPLERSEFTVIGKGKKTRIVFLSDRAKKWLMSYLADRKDSKPALFVGSRGPGSEHLSANSIEAIVRKYTIISGITKRVSPHTIRHTFATELLMNGADIRSVQEMLGHASIATTQRYTHVTNHKLREVHSKFHQ